MRERVEAVGIGEAMALLDPVTDGPLEESDTLALRTAGAEANALIGLARLGHRTAFVSAVGDDPFGTLIVRTLRTENVDVTGVGVNPKAPTGVFFKERLGDHRRRVYYYRAGSAASRLGPEAADTVAGFRPRVLLVSGLSLGLGGSDGLAGAVAKSIRRSHAAGVAVVFDANLRPGIWDGPTAVDDFAAVRPFIDYLLAGRDELNVLVPDRDEASIAFECCAEGMRAVVVKDEARGATLFEGREAFPIPAVPAADVVDTVGAGDAFAAGFISGILRGWPLPHCARLGAALGSAVVGHTGDWENLPRGAEARRIVASLEPAARSD